MLLLSIIFMDILSGMEFDLFVPSFPQLQSHFSLTPFWVEALLSVNFIGYCLSLCFVGTLADRYGRRPIILIGLATFVVGSVLCLSIDAFPAMLIGRFLQGLGIAAPAILSFLIIADRYALKQQQFLFAMLNSSMNIAVAAAPVVGSYLTLYFHWQGNFAMLLALGVMVLVMALCFVPKDSPPQKQEDLSPQGYKAIFKSKPLLLLMFNILITCIPYWVFVGMSPLLYMTDLGVSLAHFGFYQGVLAFVFALGSIGFGFILKHHQGDQRPWLHFTNGIFILSFIAMLGVTVFGGHNPLLITVAMLIFVIGQIIPSIVLYPICLNILPKAKGRVSALIQGGRLILTAMSLEVAGYFYTGSFQSLGFLILLFILLTIVTLFPVIKNRDLISQFRHQP